MKFTKMHGLGNDFIIIDGRTIAADIHYSVLAVQLCHRHLGIGADGLIIAQPSLTADIGMKIINYDGSETAMCGNALRCFAKYLYEHNIIKKKRFTIQTGAGLVIPELTIIADQVVSVKVNMGRPRLLRRDIPMKGPQQDLAIAQKLTVADQAFTIVSLKMNVPHTIICLNKLGRINPAVIGPLIEKHPLFPEGTNVNFVEITSDQLLKVRTWERGTGLTLACGTGCCAAVVATHLLGKTKRQVTVQLPAGQLTVEWKTNYTVYMTGPAEEVFSGEWFESDLNRPDANAHNIFAETAQNTW